MTALTSSFSSSAPLGTSTPSLRSGLCRCVVVCTDPLRKPLPEQARTLYWQAALTLSVPVRLPAGGVLASTRGGRVAHVHNVGFCFHRSVPFSCGPAVSALCLRDWWIRSRSVLRLNPDSQPPCTGLEQILKNMHIVYLIFVGSYTDGCLGLTAADSISRGFLPTVRTASTCRLTLEYFAEARNATAEMRCVFASSAHNRPQVVGDASLGTCRVSHLAMLRMFDQHWGRVKSAEGQVSLHESL